MFRKFEEIKIGDRIGDMLVLEGFRDVKNNRRMLKCRCTKCGRERNIYEGNLRDRSGSSDHAIACSYGLKKQDQKFYDVWAHMKDRIYNENNKYYDRYGGRGLTTDYDAFVDFYDDQYTRYCQAKAQYPNKKISIDRMDNNVGYVRGNISWTTQERQTRNSTRVYEFIGVAPNGQVFLTNNQTMFANNHGLEPKHISDCIRGAQATTNGWRFYKLDPLFKYYYDNDPTIIKELYY
jgi:hypothetical protein